MLQLIQFLPNLSIRLWPSQFEFGDHLVHELVVTLPILLDLFLNHLQVLFVIGLLGWLGSLPTDAFFQTVGFGRLFVDGLPRLNWLHLGLVGLLNILILAVFPLLFEALALDLRQELPKSTNVYFWSLWNSL